MLDTIMDDYTAALNTELPGLAVAVYLHGSIALDAFNPAFSDVDFITVVSRRCTTTDLAKLTHIHRTLATKYPKPPLQGCYLQVSDLGKAADAIAPHPTYSDGVLQAAGKGDINAVTWWLLKNKGVTVFGDQPHDFTVDWDKLVADMRENLNTYWASFTTKPVRMSWLLSDYGVQWAVLGVLRQYYTFREHDITSKAGAGEYALEHLPARWHRIVQEALNIRNQTAGSLYGWRLVRAFDALQFLKFVIQTCNIDQHIAV